jgi:hypothetical protein
MRGPCTGLEQTRGPWKFEGVDAVGAPAALRERHYYTPVLRPGKRDNA